MNRIDRKFSELKKENKKALITFVTAGDPSISDTEKIVLEMIYAGADIVEIGVPFSDPVAEGKTIQRASKRALDAGTTLSDIFAMVDRLREKTDAPLLLMMYINNIFRFGTEKFFNLCKEKGIDGVIVPDLPYEEREEIHDFAEKYGIYSINLVAPTSKERIEMIAKESKGFLYCVSSNGVTGVRSEISTDFENLFGDVKTYSSCPSAVGFGISTPEQAKELSQYFDGVIIGSAIVNIIEEKKNNASSFVSQYIKSLRTALDS